MGAWTEIVDYTVPSNTTSVVLNDFGTITKDDFIKVVATFVNGTGSSCIYRLYPNNQTTDTDYSRQLLAGSGTTITAVRGNINLLGFALGSGTSSSLAYVKLSENDKFNMFANHNDAISSSVVNGFTYTTTPTLTFTSGITSLTLSASVTNGIGTGSRIQIYRLDAEKVADITVGSNTTQVDIANLSIGKDSEYLLVSDVASISNEAFRYRLTPNDLKTESGYYVQEIRGNGSTASAARFNVPAPTFVAINTRSLVYSHIKLSEIGAYTVQNYSIDQIGSSSVSVRNSFISSTSEAITSITKLNIFDGNTNASILSGSRFILYKLK